MSSLTRETQEPLRLTCPACGYAGEVRKLEDGHNLPGRLVRCVECLHTWRDHSEEQPRE